MGVSTGIQDCKKSIRSAGFDEHDFGFQTCAFHMRDKVRFTTEKTIVIRKSNGISRVYNASNGTYYPFEFAEDLKTGLFGA
jgi:hypothetical protein